MEKIIQFKDIKKIIPSGSQLLSKRPELYSEKKWPSIFRKAKGCFVWDIKIKNIWICLLCLLEHAYWVIAIVMLIAK